MAGSNVPFTKLPPCLLLTEGGMDSIIVECSRLSANFDLGLCYSHIPQAPLINLILNIECNVTAHVLSMFNGMA